MLEISIPGYKDLQLDHLVLDYNGVLACDGKVLPGVQPALERLAPQLKVHILTADTFGSVRSSVEGFPVELHVLPADHQDVAKADYVNRLGADNVVCVGNGRNDRRMVKEAALGIAVIQEEGAGLETLLNADVVCPNVLSAFQLLQRPKRLIATLRS